MHRDASLEADVFGVLYQQGAQAVFAVHRDTRVIVAANVAAAQLVGRDRDDLVGAPVAEVFDDVAAADRVLTRPGLHEEVAMRREDGYPLFATLHVTHLDHPARGALAACVATDHTERLLLERELIAKHSALYAAHAELERVVARLRATQERLEQRNQELIALGGQLALAARRAAIGEFSAGVAHSINNPMAALSSTLRRIEKIVRDRGDAELTEMLAPYFDRARRATGRMEQIVASVRAAHKAGQLESDPREMDLAHEVDVALSLFEPRMASVEVIREGDDHAPIVAPPDAVHHILGNLIENALNAMADRGTLTLVLQAGEDAGRLIVRDTGPGVPEAIRDRVFEPFVSGRRDGTGLGLSVAQRLAKQCGGDLRLIPCESGAAFEASFPARSPRDGDADPDRGGGRDAPRAEATT